MNLSLTIDPLRFGSESRVLIIVLGVILPRLILAQSASPGVSAGTAVPSPITVLNPYVVDMTLDRGYQATNTLSGSRLNSSLRDTPSSISVFTKEFLQDVGLDDLGELVG